MAFPDKQVPSGVLLLRWNHVLLPRHEQACEVEW